MQHNVAIISSPPTYRSYVAQAEQKAAIYRFDGAEGSVTWLKGHYAYFAVNGAESFLRRLGIKYDIVPDDTVTSTALDAYHTLIIPDAENLQNHAVFEKWVSGKHRQLIVIGRTNLPDTLLGCTFAGYQHFSHPTGMQWKSRHFFLSPQELEVRIVALRPGAKEIAALGEYVDTYTPDFRLLKHPAVFAHRNVLCFTQSIFEYIGSILEGAMSIESVRHFYPPFLFVDELLLAIRNILEVHAPQLFQLRVPPWGPHDRIVVLRHDVDFSDDPTYARYEIDQGIPATYPLLLDEHLSTWLTLLKDQPNIEISFHYSSAQPESLRTRIRTHLARIRGDVHWGAAHPGKRIMSKDGLLRQIHEAEAQGIRCDTAHRHENFFFYPETVDAMHYLYRKKKNILGLGTMFRYECFQYGESAITVEYPETAVPFWFPYKLYYASTRHHEPLRGWDSTQLMEPNPQETYALLSSKLENGVFTFGFHPKHAHSTEFNIKGNVEWFKAAIDLAKHRKCVFMTSAEVYERLTASEALRVNLTGNLLTIHNTYWLPMHDVRILVHGQQLNFKMVNAQQKIEKRLEDHRNARSA